MIGAYCLPVYKFYSFTPDFRLGPERPFEQPEDQVVKAWPTQLLGLPPHGSGVAEKCSLGFQNPWQVVDRLFGGIGGAGFGHREAAKDMDCDFQDVSVHKNFLFPVIIRGDGEAGLTQDLLKTQTFFLSKQKW